MHTEKREDPLVEMGYEIRDVDYKKLRSAIVWFFAFTLVSIAAGYVIWTKMNPAFSKEKQATNADVTRRVPPSPNPLLQDNVTAKTDMMLMRQEEQARLHGTGTDQVVDGRVHIPIERAIDILAERGLPNVGGDVPAVTRGNTTDQRPDPVPAQVDAPATEPSTETPAPGAPDQQIER